MVAFLATAAATRPRPRRGRQQAEIPEGNLTSNPSFEQNTDGWGLFQATLTREPADDAPDGEYVARVTLAGEPSEYSIDDDPDVLETSAMAGTEYVAAAWVKATPETDGRPICIAIREWTVGRPRTRTPARRRPRSRRAPSEYRRSKPATWRRLDGNTIDVHVYRYPGEMVAGESFLVDAITVTEGTDTSENTQLVDDATCGA